MRIDVVNGPDIQGLSPAKALEKLADHCHDTAVQIMRMSNEIEDLKDKVSQLERNQR